MRILHVCLDYPPRRTQYGSGTITDDLVAAQSRAGHEVVVLTPGRPERMTGLVDANGVGLLQVPSALTARHLAPSDRPNEMFTTPANVADWNDDAASWFQAKLPLARWAPDVVHNDGWTTQVVAEVVAETYGSPLVTTAHVVDRHFRSVPGRRPQAVDHEYEHAERHSFVSSDLIIVPSQTAADLARHYLPESAGKLRVVPHGLDWRSVDAMARTASLAPRAGVRVLYVGRLSSERSWLPFLDAFTAAAERDPRLTLGVIGTGPGLREAQGRWSSSNITFLGRLARPDAIRELAAVDIFCNPALIETFGVAEAEALGLGVCVISGSGFGKHTHIEHRVTGIQIPLEGSTSQPTFNGAAWSAWLSYLAADAPLRRQLAEQGRQLARKRFDIERMVRELDCVYQEAGGHDLPRSTTQAARRPE